MAKKLSLDNPKVNNLVRDIENGEIKVPPLQRPFVWKIEQIIDLLESIYKDYPIGSILLWETNSKLPFERNIAGFKLPNKPASHPFYYVLDGQQRLSSLYGVFATDRTLEENPSTEYRVDLNTFDIFFDLKNKKFVHRNSISKLTNRFFSMKSLFNTSEYSNALINATKANRKKIEELYRRFTNYEVSEIITKQRDIAEVGVIFERVNNTSTKLDLFDLMVALTWTKTFHLQNEIKQIKEILERKNFSGIKNKIILQCLSCIIKESSSIKVITKLKGDEIRLNIVNLKKSLEKTVDYLSTELSVKTIQLLPHAHQIVPLCYFFSKTNTPSAEQKKYINKWFWSTSFSNRFTASTDRHIDEDVASFRKVILSDFKNAFKNIKYSVTEEQLIETKFIKSSPFSRAFVVLLANRSPLNLLNSVKVDTGKALSSFNSKEYHHIFPKKFLLDKDVPLNKVNSLCNFCIVPSDSNKTISDEAPSDYFFKQIPKINYLDILNSNLIPIDVSLYRNNDYEAFIKERAKIIIKSIRNLSF